MAYGTRPDRAVGGVHQIWRSRYQCKYMDDENIRPGGQEIARFGGSETAKQPKYSTTMHDPIMSV